MARSRTTWWRWLAGGLAVIVIAALAVPFVVPLARFIPQITRVASEKLGQPVAISALRLQLLPVPGVTISGLTVGRHAEIAIASAEVRPALLAWLAGHKVIDEISADKVRVREAAIKMIETLPKSQGGGEPVLVRRVVLRQVKFEHAGLQLPEFDLDVALAPGLGVERALLKTRDGALQVAVTPQSAQEAKVDLAARKWRLPVAAAPLAFDSLEARGALDKGGVQLPRIDGRLYGGTLAGNARIEWARGWRLAGKADVSRINLAPVEQALGKPVKLTGRLSGNASFSSHARSAGELGKALALDAPFRVDGGEYHGIDLSRVAELPLGKLAPGGGTRFDELRGVLALRGKRVRISAICAKSSVLVAAGHVEIAPDQKLSGKLDVSIAKTKGYVGVPVELAGTTSDPSVKLTTGATIGAVLGTVLLPGIGTTLGASAGGTLEGKAECK
ncbi:MAG: AsmA family protein [Betaproteobacteria bacterium]|nr:AsmA family protein [Betaproteobacteria bacterium]